MAVEPRYWYVLLGGVGFLVFAHYFPVLKQLGSNSMEDMGSLEQIPGIDLEALLLCKQKGLM